MNLTILLSILGILIGTGYGFELGPHPPKNISHATLFNMTDNELLDSYKDLILYNKGFRVNSLINGSEGSDELEQFMKKYLTDILAESEPIIITVKEESSNNSNYGVTSYFTKVRNLITFTNLAWTFFSIVFLIAFFALFGRFIILMSLMIPQYVYELVGYQTSFLLTYFPKQWGWVYSEWFMIVGALALFPLVSITVDTRRPFGFSNLSVTKAISYVLTILWALITISHNSTTMGFFTCLALMTGLGFSFFALPICYVIGFREENSIPQIMSASFMMLSGSLLSSFQLLNVSPYVYSYIKPFETGALFMGTLVFTIGLLIVSSKSYIREHCKALAKCEDWTSGRLHDGFIFKYLHVQMVSAFMYTTLLYIGTVYDINTLKSIVGTTFFLFIMEKEIELTWDKLSTSWFLLFISIVGGTLTYYIRDHPEYFIF
jgi:hypothetical protein